MEKKQPLPNPAKPEPRRTAIHRRGAEIAEIRAEKKNKNGAAGRRPGFPRRRAWSAEQAESAEESFCQFRQEFDSVGATVVTRMGSLTPRDFASEPRPGYLLGRSRGRERSYARKPSLLTESYLEPGRRRTAAYTGPARQRHVISAPIAAASASGLSFAGRVSNRC